MNVRSSGLSGGRSSFSSTSFMRLSRRGLGLAFSAQTTPVAGRQRELVRHPVGIGLIEGDREQDIDDASGHRAIGPVASDLRMREGRGEIYSAMSSATPDPDRIPAAPDVAREMAQWLSYLAAERRMSPKTVEAYERDLRQFLGFLSGHLDGRVTLSALARLAPLDVRAFLAARRADGIGSRSLMRGLAGVRSFARFLERGGNGQVGALAAVRAPKIAKTLPKPLAISAAKEIVDTDLRAGEEREPWILARDAAVLALLYGSGLRISEALGLPRKEIPAPGRGDAITVTGKGNKKRMVPVLPRVLQLVADYVALCPYDLPADGALFVGA